MNYDLGDSVPLTFSVTNANGGAVNATVALTVYLPDGTTTSPSVTNGFTGNYTATYVPTLVGRHAVKWVATGVRTMALADEFNVRDFSTMGIVGLTDVKRHLNYLDTETADDDELQRIIDVATDMAQNFTGLILGRQTFTSETYNGGDSFIKLRHPFALSVASVYENNVLLDATQYTLNDSNERLLRITSSLGWSSSTYGNWAAGANNITVTYTAGFITPPFAAQQGVLEIIRHLWQTQRGSMFQGGGNLPEDLTSSAYAYSMPLRAEMLLNFSALPGIA